MKRVTALLWIPFGLTVLACSFVSGSAAATPTVWIPAPTDAIPAPAATNVPSVPPAANAEVQELSILRCQNNPGAGFVSSSMPITLVWGWTTDNEAKRDEIISISSFALLIDGQSQNVGTAETVFEGTDTVKWKLLIGTLPAGSHQVRLTIVLDRLFTENYGTFAAGNQPEIICDLTVQ